MTIQVIINVKKTCCVISKKEGVKMTDTLISSATYSAEYLEGKEIANLLLQLGNSENGDIAKVRINSFLEGFTAGKELCKETADEK